MLYISSRWLEGQGREKTAINILLEVTAMHIRRVSLLCFAFVFLSAFTAGYGLSDAAAQNSSQKWSYFKFKSGQFFKYEMKSERGLKGWLSIKIEDESPGVFNVTLAGKWTGEFSETAKLKPGMSAFDLVYAFKNVEIPNAAGSLLNINADVVDNTTWKDGFHWTQGDSSIEVKGEKECAGIKGLLVTYSNKVFGRVQKSIYCVNSNIPLPLYAEVPAANDTWTYELVESKGI
jgi:hypothetical protein